MSRLMLWLARIWAVLFALALVLFLVGTFGLLGSETGPLAAVFLVPLGLPWIWFVDIFPEPLWPWLGAIAPLANIAILYGLYRFFRKRQQTR